MNIPEGPVSGPRPVVRLAGHAQRRYDDDIRDCNAGVAGRAGLDCVVHLTSGVWDFSVLSADYENRAAAFDTAARQLSLIVARIDGLADDADGGQLIRMVAQGNHGALFHVLKVKGQNLFGMAFDGSPQAVEQADRNLIEIVEKAADRIGSAARLPGEFRKRGTSDGMWLPDSTPPPAEYSTGPVAPTDERSLNEQVIERCRKVLDRNDIHFVGIYRNNRVLWRADLFTDPALEPLRQRLTPVSVWRSYDKVIRQVTTQLGRIMQLLALVGSDRLTRLVLDVARGAIYLQPLDRDGYFLVGITLGQTQVGRADKKMVALHRDLVELAYRSGGS